MRILPLVLVAGLLPAGHVEDGSPADADRAFAAHAAKEGVNAAFLGVLAEEGTLFRPHPVDGRAWMAEQIEDGQLGWDPRLELVSAGGDLGFTIGPYTFRRDGQVLGAGHYLSVWQRAQAGAPWRLLADLGVPHAPPEPALEYVPLAASTRPAPGEEERAALEAALRAAEVQLAGAAAEGDGAAALLDAATPELVAMRPGALPAFGLEAAAGLLESGDPRSAMELERVVLARSADLAVTWGSLRALDAQGEPGEARGGWLRIWSRREAGWRALAEVRLPPPG